MVDNVTANSGTGGAVFATDDITGVHYPITKIAFGALDTATLVADSASSHFPVKIGDPVGGGTEAAALRVTLANDSTGLVSVDDNGGSLTVDGTVTASNAAGDVAHDGIDSGNPVKIGAVAESTEITAVADGDRTNLMATLNGKLVNHPYAVPERYTSGVTAAITGTANTSVIAAPGAGLKLYVTHVLVTNSHATVGTVVEIKNGTTVLYRGNAAAAGGGFSVTLPVPLVLTANTALNAANVTTGSNTYVSASGYIAP